MPVVGIPETPAVAVDPNAPVVVNASADATAAAITAVRNPETPVVRPEGLPEGFDSVEALAAAFAELKAPKAPAGTPAVLPQTTISTPEQALAAASAKGVDLNLLSKEVLESGELSAESVALLAEKGIPKTLVDTYVAGQQAEAQVYANTLAEHAGGVEQFNAMMQWGAVGLQKSEIAAYNALLNTGNVEQAKLALDSLKAKMEASLGADWSGINGAPAPQNDGVKPFKSQAEVTAIMRTHAYKTDPAVQAEVARRLAVSKY